MGGHHDSNLAVAEKQAGSILHASKKNPSVKQNDDQSPYDKSNFFNRYTFHYLRKLNRKLRKKREYHVDDFEDHTPRACLSKNVAQRLEHEWQRELERPKREPSLARAVVRAYGLKIVLANIYFLLSECIFEPVYFYYCIKMIYFVGESWTRSAGIENLEIDSLSGTKNATAIGEIIDTNQLNQELLWNASGFMIFIILTTISIHPYIWHSSMISLEMRAALGQMIYRKSLKVDKSSRANNCNQAISLISKDLDLLELNLSQLIWIISGPVECVLLTGILATSVGIETALVSLLISSLLTLIRVYLNISLRRHTQAASADSDVRVALVNETLRAIKILRMYSWTKPLYEKIKLARLKELEGRKFKIFVSVVENVLYFLGCTGGAVITLAFGHYLMGLKTDQLVISFVYLVIMIHQRTLSRYLPLGITSYIDLAIIFERIGKYLCAPEVTDIERNTTFVGKTMNQANSIELDSVSASWLDSDRQALDKISLSARPGEMVLIAGKVGAGKSSLLQTLVNELRVTSGSIRLGGRVSYAAQESWVFSGTVRDNILFGGQMDMARYLDVLRVCCLLPDLRSFSSLDLTHVGQRGVSLSGGQKARINLARCLYQEADIYLLDDPLSAVDAHVSKHLFREALKGFLAKKTVLLVTHQLQYMRFADKILLIAENKSGSTGELGTIDELMLSSASFMESLGSKATRDALDQADLSASSLMEMQTDEEKLADELLINRIRDQPLAAGKESTEMKDTIELSNGSRVWGAFKFYVRNSGGPLEYWVFLTSNIGIRFFFIGSSMWMNYWAGFHGLNNGSFGNTFMEQMAFSEAIMIAAIIWVFNALFVLARGWQMYTLIRRAAERIHDRLMESLLWAKMRFFDLTPSGQVINRVSSDLSYMDTTHIHLLDEISLTLVSSIFMFAMIIVSDVRLGISVALMCVVVYSIFGTYIDITNTVKKVDGIRKGEIYTHTSITLDGLTTIRASGKSDMFAQMYDQAQDKSSSVSFLHTSIKRLIITRLDWVMLLFYASLVALDVFDAVRGGGMYAFVGLNLVMHLARNTQYAFTKFVELYTRIEALSRIKEYCNVEPEISEHEAQLFAHESARFKEGRLEFVGVSLRYERTGDFVLRNVSFALRAREKVGIVGRTGAGKSSLIAVLFRLYHFEGLVEIDGQDTKNLPLDSLRRSVSIIPQDPELLSGSLRRNLDPLDEHSDESLWRALEAVRLRALVAASAHQLQLPVSDSGANFSVGQRQLICLARAILRRNKLLVLDEATANVDPETDGLIQRAIRSEFAECTVLTVAHKLSTIVDSDRIMVIDKGRLVEFDTPGRLLEQDGLFASMIHSSGLQAEHLEAKIRATAS